MNQTDARQYRCLNCRGYSQVDQPSRAWNECPTCGSIMLVELTSQDQAAVEEWVRSQLSSRWGLVYGETTQGEADAFKLVED